MTADRPDFLRPMERAIRQLMLPTVLVVLALLAPATATASTLDVQRDCADSDVFEKKHSRSDLRATLPKVQADLAEYGTCKQMIMAALAALKTKAGASGTGGGIDPDLNGDGVVTPTEKRIAAKKAKEKREKRNKQIAAVSDDLIQDEAATAGGSGGSGGSSLPLILTLAALLCAGVGGGLWYASKRNPAVANTLRRVPLPFRNS
jgi:outer membrane receptor protein involved in Fe transport